MAKKIPPIKLKFGLKDIFRSVCQNCKWKTFSWQKQVFCQHCLDSKKSEDIIEESKFSVESKIAVPLGKSEGKSICVVMANAKFSGGRYRPGHSLLHVGISNSSGNVFNFDEKGRKVDKSWEECLNVKLSLDSEQELLFDQLLEEFFQEELLMSKFSKYHSLLNNCYNFVLRFLNKIRYQNRDDHSKESIVLNLISQPVEKLEEFLRISMELEKSDPKNPVVLVPPLETTLKRSNRVCDICGQQILPGLPFYHCDFCSDFDSCIECYFPELTAGAHLSSHSMTFIE